MVKIYTALNKEERLLKRENLSLKFEVFMEKIFTALNKELAKFFPLNFDYLLTFRTLKVQCFTHASHTFFKAALRASLPSAKARGAICVSVLESELSDTPPLDYQGVSASHQEGVGIYVPPHSHHEFYAL